MNFVNLLKPCWQHLCAAFFILSESVCIRTSTCIKNELCFCPGYQYNVCNAESSWYNVNWVRTINFLFLSFFREAFADKNKAANQLESPNTFNSSECT